MPTLPKAPNKGRSRQKCCCSGPCAPVPEVRRVTSELSVADRFGGMLVRWNFRRGNYRVEPGLYALGTPTPDSPVLVSANYKLSFDHLRARLPGVDAWILVLDTRGVNVWCAAGKGTFGTGEIVRQVMQTGLAGVVTHRTLVVPQLGAPGVAAHEVLRQCGFRVRYGPVRAADLPAYLAAGMEATAESRRVRFTLWERLKVMPVELMKVLPLALFIGMAITLLSGLGDGGFDTARIGTIGLPSAAFFVLTAAGAAVLTPALLPWLPGRAFAFKGLWIGLAAVAATLAYAHGHPLLWEQWAGLVGWALVLPALSSYIAMNFTGASSYTSLSGVLAEMRIAVPLQAMAVVVGAFFWAFGRVQ